MQLGTVNQVVAGSGFLLGGVASYLVVNALEPESSGLLQNHCNSLFYLLDAGCGIVCAGISVGLASWCADYRLERSIKREDIFGIRAPLAPPEADFPSSMPCMRS